MVDDFTHLYYDDLIQIHYFIHDILDINLHNNLHVNMTNNLLIIYNCIDLQNDINNLHLMYYINI